MSSKCKRPGHIAIGRREAEKLYELESLRNKAISECATEWLLHMKLPASDYWSVAMPQALFDTLDSYDKQYSTIAAQAYLEGEGYTVQSPDQEDT